MKLPENTLIAQEKLTEYLLVSRKRNNKSQWLAEAGYILENWKILEPIAKVVIPVQTGIQKFLQHIEKTGFPLSWE